MYRELSTGLHCRACNAPLRSDTMDPELCDTCMEVVVAYNRDLEEEEEEQIMLEIIEFDERIHSMAGVH